MYYQTRFMPIWHPLQNVDCHGTLARGVLQDADLGFSRIIGLAGRPSIRQCYWYLAKADFDGHLKN